MYKGNTETLNQYHNYKKELAKAIIESLEQGNTIIESLFLANCIEFNNDCYPKLSNNDLFMFKNIIYKNKDKLLN